MCRVCKIVFMNADVQVCKTVVSHSEPRGLLIMLQIIRNDRHARRSCRSSGATSSLTWRFAAQFASPSLSNVQAFRFAPFSFCEEESQELRWDLSCLLA